MDSHNQPSRPPRGPRGVTSRDPSAGLLMNVIRNLTVTREVADRDREKQILEKEFKDSDRRLEQLVLAHHQDLSAVLQAFRKISGCLKSAKERVKANREKLLLAQKLLDCKREELRKLWLESVENKQILELLGGVESLMKVHEEFANYLTKKHYLHATDLLVQSLRDLENNLGGVEALKDLRAELLSKKDDIFDLLLDDFHKHLYSLATKEAIKRFRRGGSQSKTLGTSKHSSNVLSAVGNSAIRRRHSSATIPTSDIEEDISPDVDPEDDSKQFLVIILQCLCRLKKLPDAIEVIKVRCDQELIAIIKQTGKELLGESTKQDGSNKPPSAPVADLYDQSSDGQLLQEFVDLLHVQLVAIVSLHENVIIPHLKRLAEADGGRPADSSPLEIYSISDIRSKIQAVLQLIIDLYLDISATDTTLEKGHMLSASDDPSGSNDISSYFIKKRTLGIGSGVGGFGKAKKTALFRFDQSSHAMSLNAYFQEQKEKSNEGTGEPRFQLSEYIQLVQLLHRSLPGRDPSHLEANMRKLNDMLSELSGSV